MDKIFCSAEDYRSVGDVKAAYPWAETIIEVDGGWMVFDTSDAYLLWTEQK